MYTWFDALLVTLLAIVTALGVQRGLIGLVWGLATLLICLLANAMLPNPVLAALLALALSVGVAYVCVRLIPQPHDLPWARLAGGLGGFALGTLLVAALTLNFPLEVRRTAQGETATYPATTLPEPLHSAVERSIIKEGLMGVWESSRVLRLLVIPDRAR